MFSEAVAAAAEFHYSLTMTSTPSRRTVSKRSSVAVEVVEVPVLASPVQPHSQIEEEEPVPFCNV